VVAVVESDPLDDFRLWFPDLIRPLLPPPPPLDLSNDMTLSDVDPPPPDAIWRLFPEFLPETATVVAVVVAIAGDAEDDVELLAESGLRRPR